MLSLLGSLLGFGTSFLPKVMDYFQDRQDKAHELLVMDKQMVLQERGHEMRLEEINIDADIRETESLHRHDRKAGIAWVDALRGSVRPVVTYVMVLEFVFIKSAAMYLIFGADGVSLDTLDQVWDEETRALFAAILSFWFGHRALKSFYPK
ncbi:MAG: hypothetical protein O2967_17785 [Proteobacteria bacterium]|nr:hypothetical protein [Pseudomonadota bacterium]